MSLGKAVVQPRAIDRRVQQLRMVLQPVTSQQLGNDEAFRPDGSGWPITGLSAAGDLGDAQCHSDQEDSYSR